MNWCLLGPMWLKKGIPVEVYEHCIALEENVVLVRQRQHQLNSKYWLMVKDELNKFLKVEFIYLVPYNE